MGLGLGLGWAGLGWAGLAGGAEGVGDAGLPGWRGWPGGWLGGWLGGLRAGAGWAQGLGFKGLGFRVSQQSNKSNSKTGLFCGGRIINQGGLPCLG